MPRLLILAIGFLLIGSAAEAATGASIMGQWITDDGKAVVTIAGCGDRLCGKVSRVLDRGSDVPVTDLKNPDAGLRNRPILGLPVLYGFTRQGDRWTGGTAYDPKTGSRYRASLEVNRDGSLKVTGCVLFICQSKRWTRSP